MCRIHFLSSLLLIFVVVLVVVQQRRKVENGLIRPEALIEAKRVLANADERLQPLIDLVLNTDRGAAVRFLFSQVDRSTVAMRRQQRRDDGLPIFVRQLHAKAQLLFGRQAEEVRSYGYKRAAQLRRPRREVKAVHLCRRHV